jgi:dethiobiotin synthetase
LPSWGTDTGVGKTVVTPGPVAWLREAGRDARAVKPAQTGHPPDDDAGFVADACGIDGAATCCRRLEPALAPDVAASVANEDLSYEGIREETRAALAGADPGDVEGTGGLRVPLSDGREVLDLVADLGVPVVVVARSSLGTLNHSALTVATLDRHDALVSAVVLNRYGGTSVAERTNPDVLYGMVNPPVYTLPELSFEDPAEAAAGVRDHLQRDVFPDGVSVPDGNE